LAEHVENQAKFLETDLRPCLDAAVAGQGTVFFVDAAHFVFGTFLCCLWSFARIFVRAASGRQRFNVLGGFAHKMSYKSKLMAAWRKGGFWAFGLESKYLAIVTITLLNSATLHKIADFMGKAVLGAWNAVTHELIAVTKTTVVNTETMGELLRKIAALGLTGPITLVLDHARYRRNAAVQALAEQVGITLLFLPSYSPNLDLIERLWKFIKRRALYGRYHPTFTDFQAAIQETLDGLPITHAERNFSITPGMGFFGSFGAQR
jgi:transposase